MSCRLGALLLITLPLTGAEAQFSARADAALGAAGPIPATRGLWTLGSRLAWESPRLRLGAEGEYREFQAGGIGGWGRVTGSWFVPISTPLTGEVTGEASGLAGRGRDPAGLFTAGGRLHLHGTRRGLWLGSQAGRDGMGLVTRWESAAWQRFGNLTLQVQASQTSSRDITREINLSPDTLSPLTDTLRQARQQVHTDVGAWLGWEYGSLELSGAFGRRFGVTEPAGEPRVDPGAGEGGFTSTRGTTRAASWWMLEGRWWLTQTIGLVGTMGYQPPDGSLRTPGGRFAKFGLSAALPRGRRPPPPRPPDARAAGERAALLIERLPDDSVELTMPGAGAATVEVMADFTDWEPVHLTRGEDGRWHLRWRIPAGTYAINVRVDGGPWAPPPGVPVLLDEFGQRTGMIVVR